jgi:hypothetical protein
MPDLYTPVKRTIGDLLSTTSPRIVVSDYQRDFSWTESEADVFFRDLIAFSSRYPDKNVDLQEYFLGSMVLVTGGTDHLLLDGQQRLATATILLSVIRDHLNLYDKNAATRLGLKYMYDNDDSTGDRWYKLTLNRYDAEFFRREVQDGATTAKLPATLESHRLILKVRRYFQEKFDEKYKELGGGKAAFEWSLRIMKVLLNHMSAVVVSSSDEDNASNVFETLNDRGISLSTPDLLRNLVLRRAASDAQREEIIDAWRTVFEIEEEVKIEDFLRHYWISRKGDIKSRKLYHEMKSVITEQDIPSLLFSQDLQLSSITYRQIVSATDDDPQVREQLLAIKMLGAKALLPAVLSAYAFGEAAARIDFLRELVSVYVRYAVVSALEVSRLEDVVYALAKDLATTGNFVAAKASLAEIKPTNDTFAKRFATFQTTRRESQRYMLYEIENYERREANKTGELQLAGPDKVHVEHIYAQKPEKRFPDHQDLVNRFGNLTLLDAKLNQTIQNGLFAAKCPSYEKSDVLITRRLLDYPDWDRESIDDRQKKLAEKAVAIWN